MQKKEKIVKSTNKPDKPSKKRENLQWENPPEYRSMLTFQMMPARSDFVDRYFLEFNKEARENEEILFLGDFLKTKGIARQTWLEWKEKSPERQQLYDEAMEYIGMRRERGALKKQFSEKTVHFMQPLYSKDWKEQQKEQAKLGIVEDRPQNIKIIMESYKDKEE
jgi:hypothetical protein